MLWWQSLPDVDKANSRNIQMLVESGEGAVAEEHSAWLSDARATKKVLQAMHGSKSESKPTELRRVEVKSWDFGQWQEKFLGNANVFRQSKLFWIMSPYPITCSAHEHRLDQQIRRWQNLLQWWLDVNTYMMDQSDLFGNRPYLLNRISELRDWGTKITASVFDSKVSRHLKQKNCWKKNWPNGHLVFVGVWSTWGVGLFLLKCHPDRIRVFCIFLLLVLLLPCFHSVFSLHGVLLL